MRKIYLCLAFAVALSLGVVFSADAQALTWTNVKQFDPAQVVILCPEVWGDYMYAGLSRTGAGAEVWRSSDGVQWTPVASGGFGKGANNTYIGGFAVFGGKLYTIVSNSVTGAEIWRTHNGTTWEQVGASGISKATNSGLSFALETWGDYLYASVTNSTTGVEVWRTSDGTTWTQANTSGFGDANNIQSLAMTVYDSKLYVAADRVVDGSEIWRTHNGTTWERVASSGFGQDANWIFMLVGFNGHLYAGTYNPASGSQIWRSSDGTSWNQVNTNGFGAATNFWPSHKPMVANGTLYVGMRDDTNGSSVWRTTNGTDWIAEFTGGHGDTHNYAIYGLAQWGDRLYLGVSNNITGGNILRSERVATMAVTTESLGGAMLGGGYSQTLTAENGTAPYTWEVIDGSLPAGLSLNGSTGKITGKATASGRKTFTVRATDSSFEAQTATKEFSLLAYRADIVTGAGVGGRPRVNAFTASGRAQASPSNLTAFAGTLKTGINVATGDLDGDGLDEIIVAPRSGGAPQVRIFDNQGRAKFTYGFYAYDKDLRCGVDVAAADLDDNGRDEIITIPGAGCPSQVRVFNQGGQPVLTPGFFAYGQSLKTGGRVAAGDVDGNGQAEIVTAPEKDALSHIRVFNFKGEAKLTPGFYAYGQTQKTGADVAVADLDRDGKAEIVTVPGDGFPAQVKVSNYAGTAVLTPGFYAYPTNVKTGFTVTAGDLDNDGKAEIITAPKQAKPAHIRTFKFNGQAVFSPGFYAYASNLTIGADVAVGNF